MQLYASEGREREEGEMERRAEAASLHVLRVNPYVDSGGWVGIEIIAKILKNFRVEFKLNRKSFY